MLFCSSAAADSVCGGGSKPHAELEVTSAAAAAAAARAPTPSATGGTGRTASIVVRRLFIQHGMRSLAWSIYYAQDPALAQQATAVARLQLC